MAFWSSQRMPEEPEKQSHMPVSKSHRPRLEHASSFVTSSPMNILLTSPSLGFHTRSSWRSCTVTRYKGSSGFFLFLASLMRRVLKPDVWPLTTSVIKSSVVDLLDVFGL